jgi:pimeloyl-ACP methyl ester carboxylesterase
MPFLQLPDIKLFYTIDDHTDPWTKPETIVFVHGFTECTEAWRCWVPLFSRHFRVVRYDLRGFGQTGPMPADFKLTTDIVIGDLAALIEHVSPGRAVHVVGGKSGGIPTMALALKRPDLVQTAHTISSPVRGTSIPTDGWLEHMATKGVGSWARWTMDGRLGSKMPPEGVDWWVDLMGRTAVSTTKPYLTWVGGVDLRPELHGMTRPVQVIGNDTPRRGTAEFRAYQELMPGSTLTMLPIEGYHAAAVDPEACAKAVGDYIKQHPAPAA